VRPYRIAKPLVVSSDHVEFWGPGARIQFAGDATLSAAGVRDLSFRGLRIDGGGAAPVLTLSNATGVVFEDVQLKGGASIRGGDTLSLSSSRFDALDLLMAETGGPSARLRGVTVDKAFRLNGDASAVKLDGCRMPSK